MRKINAEFGGQLVNGSQNHFSVADLTPPVMEEMLIL